jgi:hypothetical protein
MNKYQEILLRSLIRENFKELGSRRTSEGSEDEETEDSEELEELDLSMALSVINLIRGGL